MTDKEKIELVRENSGGIDDATDAQVLVMANALSEDTLESYREKGKVKTQDAHSK